MIVKIHENPHIFQIEVPLPNNPLRNLNCYVIQDQGESLIIDTGFNRPECKEALLEGLAELGVDWDKTNVFLTHLHADHSGLAAGLMHHKPGKIYMSWKDYEYLGFIMKGERWEESDAVFLKEGFTKEQIDWLHEGNPARGYEPDYYFAAVPLEDGDQMQVGSYSFSCIMVAGHTPGQMCLYYAPKKIMFTGDHILFDITPNITAWSGIPDSLGDYLDSLVKIRQYEMAIALPSHRKNEMDVYVRIAQIIAHHFVRLVETMEAVSATPHAHATKIGSCLKWSMRGKTWEAFPLSQRWFAVGETIAHLEYLMERGLVHKEEGPWNGYVLTKSLGEAKAELEDIWRRYQ